MLVPRKMFFQLVYNITVCGPGGFADDVPEAAREFQDGRVVDFVESAIHDNFGRITPFPTVDIC
jgi:hypothetical protein